jgi:hypothetical protein
LTGCAAIHKPTDYEAAKADYGSYPKNYEFIVRDYFSRVLFDPESAQYRDWRGPSQGYVYDISGCFYGYRVCVLVNAKNRFGGYVGTVPYFFVVHNGGITKVEGGNQYGTIGAENVENICRSITYSEFVETADKILKNKAQPVKKTGPSLMSPPYEDTLVPEK